MSRRSATRRSWCSFTSSSSGFRPGIRHFAAQAGLLAMTVNLGAYTTEIFRAGIESIHHSQIEAALSLAMTRGQIFRHVVLEPAVARVWPSLVSQFILIMLTSSVCSFISVEELSGAAALIQSSTFRSFEVYIVVTLIYLALALALKAGLTILGHRLFSHAPRPLRSPIRAATGSGWTHDPVLRPGRDPLPAAIGRLDARADHRCRLLGGALGLGVALARVSTRQGAAASLPGRISRIVQGVPVLMVLFLSYFGLSQAGFELSAHRGGFAGAVDLCERVSRRHLARLHPVRAAGSSGRPRASLALSIGQQLPPCDPAAGGAIAIAADRRLPGAAREEHLGRLHHRLRRADARRTAR